MRDTRTQLFVGNVRSFKSFIFRVSLFFQLPYRVRWQDLKDLFRKAGTVLRADVSLGPDNRSRGYGTVLLATAEDAGRAVDMFNGYTWQTRVLEVRLDRLMPEYELGRVGIGIRSCLRHWQHSSRTSSGPR
jgi:RNA recognition motif-containing protein